jgi:membrane protein DedA with SNARE-associated domain
MLGFVERHGLLLLLAAVFLEQVGLPVPAVPVLVPIGALAAIGRVSLVGAVAVSVAACLVADGFWYLLGRRHGPRILKVLCRISLEPDSCVRQAENALVARGAWALLYAKFVPGLSAVAPPVAGLIRMRPWRFFLWDAAGAALWTGAYLALGWVLREQALLVLETLSALGGRFLLVVALALAAWVGWKHAQRRRFLREIEVDRVHPEELRRRLESGDEILVVDLRNAATDLESPEHTIPGAVRVLPDDIDTRMAGLPPDREVVLFCT